LGFGPIHKLSVLDSAESFDCGNSALNRFLKRYAWLSQKANSAQTYVCCIENNIVGFYSLAAGSVEPAGAPDRVVRGLGRHPVPVMILTRLAVDRHHQKKGLGRALLKDALLRILNVSDIVGIRAVLVHAKDDDARKWYEMWDFESSPTDPLHLFLLLKDLKAIVGG
jgi:GNAT superfamily N-acetyltransferase